MDVLLAKNTCNMKSNVDRDQLVSEDLDRQEISC